MAVDSWPVIPIIAVDGRGPTLWFHCGIPEERLCTLCDVPRARSYVMDFTTSPGVVFHHSPSSAMPSAILRGTDHMEARGYQSRRIRSMLYRPRLRNRWLRSIPFLLSWPAPARHPILRTRNHPSKRRITPSSAHLQVVLHPASSAYVPP